MRYIPFQNIGKIVSHVYRGRIEDIRLSTVAKGIGELLISEMIVLATIDAVRSGKNESNKPEDKYIKREVQVELHIPDNEPSSNSTGRIIYSDGTIIDSRAVYLGKVSKEVWEEFKKNHAAKEGWDRD